MDSNQIEELNVAEQSAQAAAKLRAGIEVARQAESAPAMLLDALSDVVEVLVPTQPEPAPEPATPAFYDDVCSTASTNAEPNDSEVFWVAADAVANAFDMPTKQAIERLAAIRNWQIYSTESTS